MNDPASDPDGRRMPVPGKDKVLNISRLGSEENVMEVSGSLHCHPKSNRATLIRRGSYANGQQTTVSGRRFSQHYAPVGFEMAMGGFVAACHSRPRLGPNARCKASP